jgi:hypothetical protein
VCLLLLLLLLLPQQLQLMLMTLLETQQDTQPSLRQWFLRVGALLPNWRRLSR